MYRRVSPEALTEAFVLRKDLEQGNTWATAGAYELRGDEIVAKPRLTEEGLELWKVYKPIEEEPDLFLKFARLYKEPEFDIGALEWCRRYGVPGERNQDPLKIPTRQSMSTFQKEVRRARRVLLLYEAVLNRDEKKALELLPPGNESEDILERARDAATGQVEMYVRYHCFLSLVPVHPHSLEVRSSWFFTSLLGAMYLQMFWLMALGGKVARCKDCGKIISHGRPLPEGRKQRRDKKFCGPACRQAHHRSKSKS